MIVGVPLNVLVEVNWAVARLVSGKFGRCVGIDDMIVVRDCL